MTPDERAEKIIELIDGCGMPGPDREVVLKLKLLIAAQIRVAEQAALAKTYSQAFRDVRREARQDALEAAANVAQEYVGTLIFTSDGVMTMDEVTKVRKLQREQIAEAIRALKDPA